MRTWINTLVVLFLIGACSAIFAQNPNPAAPTKERKSISRATDDPTTNVLPQAEWDRVDAAVERALAWLAKQQHEDGSFPTLDMGQPGVTSLCAMAFMAHGHLPGPGQYGKQLEK